MELPPTPILRKLSQILGEKIYLVGGTVRDWLLGKPISDLDVVIEGVGIEGVEARLRAAGLPVNPAGERFGVVRTYVDGYVVDVAVPRREEYSGRSRKPAVERTTLMEDLARRDFTINAMAMSVDGHIIDPFNGLEDLHHKRLKFVGDPNQRIAEDPLRMMRAARFAAQGFMPTPETITAVRNNVAELIKVSRERVKEEITKGLKTGRGEYLLWLHELKLLEVILPPAKLWPVVYHDCRGHHYGESILQHMVDTLNRLKADDEALLIAALLHDVAKPYTVEMRDGKIMFPGHAEESAKYAEHWMRWWRFENIIIRQVVPIVRLHMKIHEAVNAKNIRLLARVWVELEEERVAPAAQLAEMLVTLAEADAGAQYDWVRKQFAKFAMLPRVVSGKDAVELGVPEQKRAAWLRKVRELQLIHGISERGELLRMAKGVVV